MQTYAAAKLKLFEPGRCKKPLSILMTKQAAGAAAGAITYALDRDADIMAKKHSLFGSGQRV